MSIENANYIHQLNVSNPKPVDPISEGDNHIRLIKKLLTESFPSDLDGMVVPNITDNGEKYLRVNEAGDAVEWHEVQVQGAGIIPFRSQLSYKDASTVVLGAGEYTHKDQSGTLSWTEDKELTISNPSGNFAYIYLDNSGTVTPSWSENSPTWSNTARGWYLDDKRCIGAVPTYNNQVIQFYHDGSTYVEYRDSVSQGTFNSTANVTLMIPPLGTIGGRELFGEFTFHLTSPTGNTNGSNFYASTFSGSGHFLGRVEAGSGSYDDEHVTANRRMAVYRQTTTMQIYLIKDGGSAANRCTVYTNGYYLPRGM
jgi:hypothetical protein